MKLSVCLLAALGAALASVPDSAQATDSGKAMTAEEEEAEALRKLQGSEPSARKLPEEPVRPQEDPCPTCGRG